MLIDSFGRRVDYLRLSVTDRCNLRCVYCLPAHFGSFSERADRMTDDEIVSIAGAFIASGVGAIRLTGGEPLLRPGLPDLIRRLAALGARDLSLSTNGLRLAGLARALKRAGLARVNVSVDTLDPERFARITRFGALADALAGVDAALEAGLSPVKVNVVVARGMNTDEIGDFVRWTERAPVHVRFIELMPMGETGFYAPERRVGLAEVRERAGGLAPAAAAERPAGRGPAAYFRRPGARGTVGFISAVSCGFCASCNRVRLSSDGRLVACLDGNEGVDLAGPLRRGAGREELMTLIREAVRAKPLEHSMRERAEGPATPSAPASAGTAGLRPASSTRLMCGIGG